MFLSNQDSSGGEEWGDRALTLGRGSRGLSPAYLMQRGILKATPLWPQSPTGWTDAWLDAGPRSSMVGSVPGSLTTSPRPMPPRDPATLGSFGMRISESVRACLCMCMGGRVWGLGGRRSCVTIMSHRTGPGARADPLSPVIGSVETRGGRSVLLPRPSAGALPGPEQGLGGRVPYLPTIPGGAELPLSTHSPQSDTEACTAGP